MMPTTGAGAMFQDSAFLSELEQAAGASGKTPEQALKYARKCLHEIEAPPKTPGCQEHERLRNRSQPEVPALLPANETSILLL